MEQTAARQRFCPQSLSCLHSTCQEKCFVSRLHERFFNSNISVENFILFSFLINCVSEDFQGFTSYSMKLYSQIFQCLEVVVLYRLTWRGVTHEADPQPHLERRAELLQPGNTSSFKNTLQDPRRVFKPRLVL